MPHHNLHPNILPGTLNQIRVRGLRDAYAVSQYLTELHEIFIEQGDEVAAKSCLKADASALLELAHAQEKTAKPSPAQEPLALPDATPEGIAAMLRKRPNVKGNEIDQARIAISDSAALAESRGHTELAAKFRAIRPSIAALNLLRMAD